MTNQSMYPVVFNGLLPWMAISFLLSLKMAWNVLTFGHLDHEYETLPHVFLTSKVEWDPTVLDHEFTDESQWGEDNLEIVDIISASAYDEFGQYRHHVEVNKHLYFSCFNSDDIDDHIDQCVVNSHSTEIEPNHSTFNVSKTINKISPDYNKAPPFLWLVGCQHH
jgi:hypothetical protein